MSKEWGNLISSTSNGITLIGATILNVQGGDGALFPTADRKVFVFGAAFGSPADDSTAEIMKIVSVSTDAITVLRAEEGTSAKEWPSGSKVWHILTAEEISTIVRKLVQRVELSTLAFFPFVANIPPDATIPQIGEGEQLFSHVFTPEKAGNLIKVSLNLQLANTSGIDTLMTLALFDGSANALRAVGHTVEGLENKNLSFSFKEFAAAGTSPITISVRGGPNNTATIHLNRNPTIIQSLYGGVENSIMLIEEHTPG